jgi:hydroxymethylpyrimidine pyrophosphatase-like HAD family hydrolase
MLSHDTPLVANWGCSPHIQGVVLTDLDGTLVATETLHGELLDDLKMIQEQEWLVIPVTKRQRLSAMALAKSLGIGPILVASDGAIIVDHWADRLLLSVVFSSFSLRRIHSLLRESSSAPIGVYCLSDGGLVASCNSAYLERMPEFHRSLPYTLIDNCSIGSLTRVNKLVLAVADRDHRIDVVRRLRDVEDIELCPHSASNIIDVRPSGASKEQACCWILKEMRLNDVPIISMGNGDDDVGMLCMGQYSIVPSDGNHAALAVATHVSRPAREFGPSHLLRKLVEEIST